MTREEASSDGDLIYRQAVLDKMKECDEELTSITPKDVKNLPSANPQEDYKEFAEWIANEIFDEMWEYNKDSFEEVACRKLAKLGVVKANGDEWELTESVDKKKKMEV